MNLFLIVKLTEARGENFEQFNYETILKPMMSHHKTGLSSPTFCIYPWIHLHATPAGKINYCCVSMRSPIKKESGKAYDLREDRFVEAWNSPYMQNLRQQMLNGEKVAGCQTCYQQESFGKLSHRQIYNKEWLDKMGEDPFNQLIVESQKINFQVKNNPRHLDLRLSSTCNLGCRMCSPENSTWLEKEWQSLDQKSGGGFSQFMSEYQASCQSFRPWHDQDSFWSQLEEMAPHLEKIYIAGGEPTLIRANKRLLEFCVTKGYSEKIELFVNTNMTNLTDQWIQLFHSFKEVGVNASIDGHGITNDYIRYPSQWQNIDQNMRNLLDKAGDKISVGISLTTQNYNILYITDLLDYGEELLQQTGYHIHFDFLTAFRPSFLDYIQLPQKVKKEALQRLKNYKDFSKFYASSFTRSSSLRNGVDSVISRLESHLDNHDPKKLADFIEYTSLLDHQRDQSMAEDLPELHGLLQASTDLRSPNN